VINLQAEIRTDMSKTELKRIKSQRLVPGVLVGMGLPQVPLILRMKDLHSFIAKTSHYALFINVFHLEIGGTKQLVQSVFYHPHYLTLLPRNVVFRRLIPHPVPSEQYDELIQSVDYQDKFDEYQRQAEIKRQDFAAQDALVESFNRTYKPEHLSEYYHKAHELLKDDVRGIMWKHQ
jgi:ribosomal protein L25 (general stress protein Ctc)